MRKNQENLRPPADYVRAAPQLTRREIDQIKIKEYARGYDAGEKMGRMVTAGAFQAYTLGAPMLIAAIAGGVIGAILL